MASLTAFFPTVDAPNKGKKPAAATSSSSAPSPKKPTAAGRKRKADEDKDDEANGVATSSSSSSSADPDLSSPAKKQKGAAASSSSDSSAISPDSLESMVPSSWRPHLQQEFAKAYWPKIDKFLQSQVDGKVKVFPPRHQIFRALELCPFEDLKVVILGQDPYHDDGQAEGLCFSVPVGQKIPSSLNNIYKELKDDLGANKFTKPSHGNLVKWAQQGILLLNTGLTVEAHKPNSHKACGWFNFTDAIIKAISKDCRNVVFLLWGAHAQAKEKLIDASRHHILKAAHPSGLSASRGFYGCKHFSKTNALLEKDGKKAIDWQV